MNNISDIMVNLFNKQIAHELKNHQIYRYFGNRMTNIGLNKIGLFLKKQADGELAHHEKLIGYCEDRNIDIEFIPVVEVDLSYETMLDIAKLLLNVEQVTTSMLKIMAKTAWEEMDLLTYEWLMSDLIKEQIEEESLIQTFVDQLTNIGNDMSCIQLYDNSFSL